MAKLALLAALAAALVVPETALADAEFADPAGDAGPAPDVTDVFVANDSSGLFLFTIEVPSHPTLDATSELQLVIDSDLNAQTGDAGWDHLFFVNGNGWGLERWDGAQWVEDPSEVAVYYDEAALVLMIERSALGDTRGFNFYLASYKVENGQEVASDVAPDGDAVWAYSVVEKTFGIAAGPLVRAPKIARAGKAFLIGFLVLRTDWPLPADSAAVICTATLGGKKIKARQAYDAGVASCSVALPKNAKGKKLKVVIRVLTGGVSVSRTYTAIVK